LLAGRIISPATGTGFGRAKQITITRLALIWPKAIGHSLVYESKLVVFQQRGRIAGRLEGGMEALSLFA